MLFDVRAYEKGPFTTFSPDLGGANDFSCAKFSNDGQTMLVRLNPAIESALAAAFAADLAPIRSCCPTSFHRFLPFAYLFSPVSLSLLEDHTSEWPESARQN